MSNQDPPSCFVCMAEIDGSIARPTGCQCTDRHIHDTCLLELVLRSTSDDRTQCAVCLGKYTNVLVHQVVYRRCNPVFKVKRLICLCCVIILLCAVWVLVAGRYTREAAIASGCVLGIGIGLLVGNCYVIYTLLRRGVSILVERSRVCNVVIQA